MVLPFFFQIPMILYCPAAWQLHSYYIFSLCCFQYLSFIALSLVFVAWWDEIMRIIWRDQYAIYMKLKLSNVSESFYLSNFNYSICARIGVVQYKNTGTGIANICFRWKMVFLKALRDPTVHFQCTEECMCITRKCIIFMYVFFNQPKGVNINNSLLLPITPSRKWFIHNFDLLFIIFNFPSAIIHSIAVLLLCRLSYRVIQRMAWGSLLAYSSPHGVACVAMNATNRFERAFIPARPSIAASSSIAGIPRCLLAMHSESTNKTHNHLQFPSTLYESMYLYEMKIENI